MVTYILKEPTAFVYLLQSHFFCNTTPVFAETKEIRLRGMVK